jgi:phytol kinase
MPIIIAFVITLGLALIWLRINDFLVSKNIINNQLSRKIIHIGTGPIFVLCWFLFPNLPYSRFVAALVPLLITIQFILIGVGVIKDQPSVDAMSRTGDPKEILKGPLYYGVVFVLVTMLFWTESVVGIIALMILCGGDGFADILGRRVPIAKLPWSKGKSIGGSIGMFLGGLFFSYLIAIISISVLGYELDIYSLFVKLIIINIVTTIIESLPIRDLDNITVPIAAIGLGLIIL